MLNYNFVCKRKSYGSPDYEIFLKNRIFSTQLEYFSVIENKAVVTYDGTAYYVKFIPLDTDPKFEPIGRAKINGEYLYAWRNHCWRTADDIMVNGDIICTVAGFPIEKQSVILYRIGTEVIV